MARPTKELAWIIKERNVVIVSLMERGITQADIARIMRVPRNTVSMVVRKTT